MGECTNKRRVMAKSHGEENQKTRQRLIGNGRKVAVFSAEDAVSLSASSMACRARCMRLSRSRGRCTAGERVSPFMRNLGFSGNSAGRTAAFMSRVDSDPSVPKLVATGTGGEAYLVAQPWSPAFCESCQFLLLPSDGAYGGEHVDSSSHLACGLGGAVDRGIRVRGPALVGHHRNRALRRHPDLRAAQATREALESITRLSLTWLSEGCSSAACRAYRTSQHCLLALSQFTGQPGLATHRV